MWQSIARKIAIELKIKKIDPWDQENVTLIHKDAQRRYSKAIIRWEVKKAQCWYQVASWKNKESRSSQESN